MSNTLNQQKTKQIAKNTLFLYFRMALTMAISLYTSRIILRNLGVVDFGIYNVVGGVVAMLSFLTNAMTTGTQRFISFNLGIGNLERSRKVFSVCVSSHIFLALFVVLIAESLGLLFFYSKLQIPLNRLDAAFWVYQFSIATTFVSIVSIPYNAAIIAHEQMKAFAYISVFEAVAKLAIAFSISFVMFDKLFFYGLLIMMVQLAIRLMYTKFCKKNFAETKFSFCKDWSLFKEILSFFGWTLFGQMGCMAVTHGENILLNMFFGPVVNAARGIAIQVDAAISSFTVNFQVAVNPQITKSYAEGNLESHRRLIYVSAKYSCLLLILMSVPFLVETEHVLALWLGVVPENTVTFLRIILATKIFDSTANAVAVSAQATGQIKYYQIVCGIILFLALPISYFLSKMGYEAKYVLFTHFAISVMTQIARIAFLRKMVALSASDMLAKVYAPCFVVCILSFLTPMIVVNFMSPSLLRMLCVFASSMLGTLVLVFTIGMNENERKIVLEFIRRKLVKKK